jgi:hypothetical protein
MFPAASGITAPNWKQSKHSLASGWINLCNVFIEWDAIQQYKEAN